MKKIRYISSRPGAVIGCLLFVLAGGSCGKNQTSPQEAGLAPWQTDVDAFNKELAKHTAQARTPELAVLEKRFEEDAESVTTITDGYGGIVDFKPSEDSLQYRVNEAFKGKRVDWTFEVADKTEQDFMKMLVVVPKISGVSYDDDNTVSNLYLSCIMIQSPDVDSLQVGDRVRLEGVVEDFSKNSSREHFFHGVTALYHLDDAPHPIFWLGFTEVKITQRKGWW